MCSGKQMKPTKRVPSGVLKELLADALGPGTVTVLRGTPGTGKTSLLIDCVMATEPNKNECLVVLSRQGREAFINHAKGMEYDEEDLDAIIIYDRMASLDEPFDIIDTKIKDEFWTVVAIDSGSDLINKSQNEKEAEQKLGRILEDFRMTGATVIVVQEDLQRDISQPLEFMADNVVELTVESSPSGHFDRHLKVIKSCKASTLGEHILFLDTHGRTHLIDLESKPEVGPDKKEREIESAKMRPLLTGIHGLDEMLGTRLADGTFVGFGEGTTVLITGEAGSRKTLCGLFFLVAETDVPKLLISTKKQKEKLFKAQVPGLNGRFQSLTEVSYRAGHACIGELYTWVRTQIEEGKHYKRVLINTISDFAQMSAGTHHFEDILFKMLQLFNRNGGTVLLIADTSSLSNQKVLNEASLLSFADTHIEVRKAIVAYTEYLTLRIVKHWRIDYDKQIKELVLENENLEVRPSFQMFTGLRNGEPQLLDVNLKLIAENETEQSFNELLKKECIFLVGSEERVKADYYSSTEIVDIFEACMTTLPFLRRNSIIAMVDEPWVRTMINRRKQELANLACEGPHVERKKLKEVYFDWLVENCCCSDDDEGVYALPLYSDVGLFCINRSFESTKSFDYTKPLDGTKKDATEWEKVKTAAKRAQKNGAEYGFLFNVFLPDTVASFVLELIWGHDASCFWEGSFNISACTKALGFLQNLVKDEITPSYSKLCHLCQPENRQDPTDTQQSRLCKVMLKAAFFRTWYSQLVNTFENTKSPEEFKVSVTVLPTADPKGEAHSVLGPWYIVGFSGPAPQAVAALVGELSSAEKERRRFLAGAGLPVRKDIAQQLAKQQVRYTDLNVEQLKTKLLDKGRCRSAFGVFTNLRDILFDSAVIMMDDLEADPEEFAKKIELVFRRGKKSSNTRREI